VAVLAADGLRLNLDVFDYLILALYFITVLGVGFAARRAISTSADFAGPVRWPRTRGQGRPAI
jgi:solute:Na+ symporter, SSS family